MDINPQSTKPMSDDQELAKVLAGINQQTDQAMQFGTITNPTPAPSTPPVTDAVVPTPNPVPQPNEPTEPANIEAPVVTPAEEPEPTTSEPVESTVVEETPVPSPMPSSATSSNNDLTSIKKDALNDLRPLVDKLDIAPQEKFDTYLLLIRSTDDKSLIAPAYAAAQAITEESNKAQALLDIIKEIDYLSNTK